MPETLNIGLASRFQWYNSNHRKASINNDMVGSNPHQLVTKRAFALRMTCTVVK